jgi:hypothetical protein
VHIKNKAGVASIVHKLLEVAAAEFLYQIFQSILDHYDTLV